MVTMQNICFSFFVEGNIQGKKKTKKEIKKTRDIWTQFPQGKLICLDSSIKQDFLINLCYYGHKNLCAIDASSLCTWGVGSYGEAGKISFLCFIISLLVFSKDFCFFTSWCLFHNSTQDALKAGEKEKESAASQTGENGEKNEAKNPPPSYKKK